MPAQDLFCADLVKEFEDAEKEREKRKRPKDDKETKKKKESTGRSSKRQKAETPIREAETKNSHGKLGFEYGDQVEEIIGARMIFGELNLYCSWYVRVLSRSSPLPRLPFFFLNR